MGNPRLGERACVTLPRLTNLSDEYFDDADLYQITISGLGFSKGTVRYTAKQLAGICQQIGCTKPDLIVFWVGLNDAKQLHFSPRTDGDYLNMITQGVAFMEEVRCAINPDAEALWVGPGSAPNGKGYDGLKAPHWREVMGLNKKTQLINKKGSFLKEFPRVKFQKLHHFPNGAFRDASCHLKERYRWQAARYLMDVVLSRFQS
jgi:hypothetical protein